MPASMLDELLKQAESLNRKDQLRLASRLIDNTHSTEYPSLKWKDIRGSVEYPVLGEDAQTWISRNRAESDLARKWSDK